jgi:glycine hydroxymethyltransferase
MVEKDMDEIAGCIDLVLRAIGTDLEAAALVEARTRIHVLTGRFPLPYQW